MSRDANGREWASADKLKAGDTVECDGDFTCIPAGATRVVCEDHNGLYIACADGKHYLDGQLDFGGGPFYVGLYQV
jgi:hypothetical protein